MYLIKNYLNFFFQKSGRYVMVFMNTFKCRKYQSKYELYKTRTGVISSYATTSLAVRNKITKQN